VENYWTADFQLVCALTQMPHIDLWAELQKRKGSEFTEAERRSLTLRVRAANYWIEHYSTEEERTVLQSEMPAAVAALTASQRGFLRILGQKLQTASWDGDALQATLFDAARLTPISQPEAFKSLYVAILNKQAGPKAGNFLSFLDRSFVTQRLAEVPLAAGEFWQQTALTHEAAETWLTGAAAELQEIHAVLDFQAVASDGTESGCGVVEFRFVTNDQKKHAKRVIFEPFKTTSRPTAADVAQFETQAKAWIQTLSAQTNLTIPVERQQDQLYSV
jgi:hypothetical protein